MNIIKPFKGITYNQKKIIDISKVLAPPYDIISEKQQSELYMKSSFNIVRLILGKDLDGDNKFENKYTRARQYLEQWLESEILIQDDTVCFYICAQDYTLDKPYTRWGFIGLYQMQSKDRSMIFPHEHTYSELKQDRLNLLKQVEANLSPIFSLYSDTDNLTGYIKSMCERWDPYIDTEINNVRYRMWKLRDKVSVDNIMESMYTKPLFIADGHHRLEVAMEYQKLSRSKKSPSKDMPFDYTMMYFTSLEDKGLQILPIHRLVKLDKDKRNYINKLKEIFKVKPYESLSVLKTAMNKTTQNNISIVGLFDGNLKKFYGITLKPKMLKNLKENISHFVSKLDVLLLHQILFGQCLDIDLSNVRYIVSTDEAISKVRNGEYDVAFLLNPVRVEQLQEIVRAGERLPPKSTFFYPKIITGLTMYKF